MSFALSLGRVSLRHGLCRLICLSHSGITESAKPFLLHMTPWVAGPFRCFNSLLSCLQKNKQDTVSFQSANIGVCSF